MGRRCLVVFFISKIYASPIEWVLDERTIFCLEAKKTSILSQVFGGQKGIFSIQITKKLRQIYLFVHFFRLYIRVSSHCEIFQAVETMQRENKNIPLN